MRACVNLFFAPCVRDHKNALLSEATLGVGRMKPNHGVPGLRVEVKPWRVPVEFVPDTDDADFVQLQAGLQAGKHTFAREAVRAFQPKLMPSSGTKFYVLSRRTVISGAVTGACGRSPLMFAPVRAAQISA